MIQHQLQKKDYIAFWENAAVFHSSKYVQSFFKISIYVRACCIFPGE